MRYTKEQARKDVKQFFPCSSGYRLFSRLLKNHTISQTVQILNNLETRKGSTAWRTGWLRAELARVRTKQGVFSWERPAEPEVQEAQKRILAFLKAHKLTLKE